jgi:hypothetical protein
MTTPTTGDVLDAFDADGGQVVQSMALKFALERRGFDVYAASDAINQALADGLLGQTPAGGLFKRTS